MRWLESQLEITENLRTKWKETSKYRLNKLQKGNAECITFIKRSGKCFINSYLVKYPFLRQPNGYTLVRLSAMYDFLINLFNSFNFNTFFILQLEQDFVDKYPEKEYSLFANWNSFKIKVKEITGKNEGKLLLLFSLTY